MTVFLISFSIPQTQPILQWVGFWGFLFGRIRKLACWSVHTGRANCTEHLLYLWCRQRTEGATTVHGRAHWLFCQEQLKLANFRLLLLIMKCLQAHQDFSTCTHYSESSDERFVQTCFTAHGLSTNHSVWPSFRSSKFTDCQVTCQPHCSFQPSFLWAEKGEQFPGTRIRGEDKCKRSWDILLFHEIKYGLRLWRQSSNSEIFSSLPDKRIGKGIHLIDGLIGKLCLSYSPYGLKK